MTRYFLIDYYLGHLTEKRFTTVDDRKTFLLNAQVTPVQTSQLTSRTTTTLSYLV